MGEFTHAIFLAFGGAEGCACSLQKGDARMNALEKAKCDIEIALLAFNDLKDESHTADHALQIHILNLKHDLNNIARTLQRAIENEQPT